MRAAYVLCSMMALLIASSAQANCIAWFARGGHVVVSSNHAILGGTYCSVIERSDQTLRRCSGLPASHQLVTGVRVSEDVSRLVAQVDEAGPTGQVQESSCLAVRDERNLLFTPEVTAASLAFLLTTVSLLVGALFRGGLEKRRAVNEWRGEYLKLLGSDLATGDDYEPPITNAYLRGGWAARRKRKKMLEAIVAELKARNVDLDTPLENKTRTQLVARLRSII